VVFSTSCSTTKTLQDNEVLLKKNVVVIDGDQKVEFNVGDIEIILNPKPNKKFLGIIPFKIWAYNIGMRGKKRDGKIRSWLRNSAGEKPVLYDSLSTKSSMDEVIKYLNKTGYFHSAISHHAEIKKQKARSIFTIQPAEPYRIRNFNTEIEDSVLSNFVGEIKDGMKIKSGAIINAFILEDEREKIAEHLKQNGYYYFNQNYIYYELDTGLNSHECDVFLKSKKYQLQSDTGISKIREVNHRRYYINNIFINTEYNPLNKDYGISILQ